MARAEQNEGSERRYPNDAAACQRSCQPQSSVAFRRCSRCRKARLTKKWEVELGTTTTRTSLRANIGRTFLPCASTQPNSDGTQTNSSSSEGQLSKLEASSIVGELGPTHLGRERLEKSATNQKHAMKRKQRQDIAALHAPAVKKTGEKRLYKY